MSDTAGTMVIDSEESNSNAEEGFVVDNLAGADRDQEQDQRTSKRRPKPTAKKAWAEDVWAEEVDVARAPPTKAIKGGAGGAYSGTHWKQMPAPGVVACTQWTPDEDCALMAAIDSIGCHWGQVADYMHKQGWARTSAMCRNRYARKQAPLKPGKAGVNLCKRCGQVKRGHTCTAEAGAEPPRSYESMMKRPGPGESALNGYSHALRQCMCVHAKGGRAGSAKHVVLAPKQEEAPDRNNWTEQEDTLLIAAVAKGGRPWSAISKEELVGRSAFACCERWWTLQGLCPVQCGGL